MNGEGKSVADVGEFGLIDRIKETLPHVDRDDLIIGIGDDTAVIRLDKKTSLLITCDIQIEDRHFRLDHITAYQLGRRAIAVNLSDIAAMGGHPTYALVSLGIPASFPLSSFEQLFQGIRDQLKEFSAFVIGGNLAHTEQKVVVDITLLGEVPTAQIVYRSGAQPGDRIYVTGVLGASGAGFHLLEKFGSDYPKELEYLVQAHLQPTPRIRVGSLIAQSGVVTSMIDVSDGVISDLFHICEMSGVGAEVYQERLPLPDSMERVRDMSGVSVLDLALHSGEDYELLFSVEAGTPSTLIEAIARKAEVKITGIGQIVSGAKGICLIDDEYQRHPLERKGWDHFRRRNL